MIFDVNIPNYFLLNFFPVYFSGKHIFHIYGYTKTSNIKYCNNGGNYYESKCQSGRLH